MNIVLIGYRGTGKSVAADLLSSRLSMKKISMDEEIVKTAGMPIPEIVAKHGWDKFRDIESGLAKQLSKQDNLILDTGGGVIEREQNIEELKKNGLIFWLKASPEVIVKRIGTDNNRPALTQGKTFTEEVAEVLDRRTPKYAAAADHEIDTDNSTPEKTAEFIAGVWAGLH